MMLTVTVLAGGVLWMLLLARSALNNLSPVALSKLAEEKSSSAHLLKPFLERKPSFLVTLQAGIMGSAAGFAMGVASFLGDGLHGIASATAVAAGIGSCFILTVFAQVLAALEPKVALAFSLPFLMVCSWVLAPFSWPLGALLQVLLRSWEQRQEESNEDKEEEIAALIDVGEREGILEGEDSVLIEGVLAFGDTVVREVMTPRTDMICAEAGMAVEGGMQLLARTRHTRLPLYDEQVDNIVGVVYAKELLGPLLNQREQEPMRVFMRPVFFVPENKQISKLLREFQEKKVQLAIVVDEYGGVDGLVTSEDLLEEIVGEIQESDEAEEAPFRKLADGKIEALGRASIYDLGEEIGVSLKEGDYDSVAGWVITALGTIPHPGTKAVIEGLQVEVLQADKKRIHRVRIAAETSSSTQSGEESQ